MSDASSLLEFLLVETTKSYCDNFKVADNISLSFLLPNILVPLEFGKGVVPFGFIQGELVMYKIGIHIVCFGPSVSILLPGKNGIMGYACSVLPSSMMVGTGELPSSNEIAEVTKRFYITVTKPNSTESSNDDNYLH